MLLHTSHLRNLLNSPGSKTDRVFRKSAFCVEALLTEAVLIAGSCVVTQALLDLYSPNLLANNVSALGVMLGVALFLLMVDVKVAIGWIKRHIHH